MPNIRISVESKRGCGYRKPGGIYLVSKGIPQPCGRLPLVLDRCPCCGEGIKATRGWQTVDADALFATQPCATKGCRAHSSPDEQMRGSDRCPASRRLGKSGLLWVGGKFYPTPEDWTAEANRMGVSRRISAVPKDLKLGETWVLVAHRECVTERCDCGVPCPDAMDPDNTVIVPDEQCGRCHGDGQYKLPAIFHMFKPEAIEYVVKGDETEEDLERLVKRGLTPVKVVRDVDEQPELNLGERATHTLADDLPGSY